MKAARGIGDEKSTLILIIVTVAIVLIGTIARFSGSSVQTTGWSFIQDGWQYRWGTSLLDSAGSPLWAKDLSDAGWHPMQFPAHFIFLPQDFRGGTLMFQINSPYSSIGIHSPLELDSFSRLFQNKLGDDMPKIITSAVMFFASIGATIIWLYSRERRYVFFSGYTLAVSMLNFSATLFKGYLLDFPTFWMYLVLSSIFLLQIFWLAFLQTMVDAVRRRYVRWILWLMIAILAMAQLSFSFDAASIGGIIATAFLAAIANYLLMWWALLPRLREDLSTQIYVAGATVWMCFYAGDALVLLNFPNIRVLHSPYGQFIDAIALAGILAIQFKTIKRENEQYALSITEKNVKLEHMQNQLHDWNTNLEETVARRTAELEDQKAKLQYQQANWQQLFSNSPQAIAVLNGEGYLIEVNDTFHRLFQYRTEDVQGQMIGSFITSSRSIVDCMDDGNLFSIGRLAQEVNFRSRDGRLIPVAIIAYPYQTLTGEPGIFWICSDISERKQVEEALQNSERKYRLIAENTGDIIWTIDASGHLTYVSPAIQNVLGYTPEQIMDLPLPSLLNASATTVTLEAVRHAREALHAGKMNVAIESGVVRSDGIEIWTESIVNLQRSETGEILGLLGITRDITGRHEDELQIRQPYELYLRNEFFNRILEGKLAIGLELFSMAIRYHINLPNQYVLCYIQIDSCTEASQIPPAKPGMSAMIASWLNRQPGFVAWESSEGIGLLIAQEQTGAVGQKEKEINQAHHLLEEMGIAFPALVARIGIAEAMHGGMSRFCHRYHQARDAVLRGREFWPDQRIYHYLNCGVLQFLSPFATAEEAATFIEHTLGPLIHYDRENQTDLVYTVEKIIYGDNLKVVAAEMFFHHKTIVLRKQRIEKVLGQSLDSFEVKLKLGVALKLMRMRKKNAELIQSE